MVKDCFVGSVCPKEGEGYMSKKMLLIPDGRTEYVELKMEKVVTIWGLPKPRGEPMRVSFQYVGREKIELITASEFRERFRLKE